MTNVSNFTITSVVHLQDCVTNCLSELPDQFIDPVLEQIDASHQVLRFRLITDLVAYMRTATTPMIELGYELECLDGTTGQGTLLLDIIDENNIPPAFHFANMLDQD